MLQMKIKTGRRSVVPGDLPSILGARRAYRELGDMVEALIAQMDTLAGDCDFEDDDPVDGIDDVPHDHDDPLRPLYGLDQTAGPVNYRHAVDIYKAADALGSFEEGSRGARYWARELEQIGAYDPARHAAICPGYDA